MERSHAVAEGHDVLLWVMVGDVCAADVHELYATQDAFCEGKAGIYVIVDMRRMRTVDGEARKVPAQRSRAVGKSSPLRGVAIVGGTFQMRVMGKMVNTAQALLRGREVTPIEFFETRDDAFAWIDRHRRSKAPG